MGKRFIQCQIISILWTPKLRHTPKVIYKSYHLISTVKEEQMVMKSGRPKQREGNGRTSFQSALQDLFVW